MAFINIWSYDNYVPAHIAAGRLKEEGIECWLQDENTVTIDPILSNAIGGIKLMVAERDVKKALDILNTDREHHKSLTPCPKCNSQNIELILSQRKASNVFSAIFGYFFLGYPLAGTQLHHCFDCGCEYPLK